MKQICKSLGVFLLLASVSGCGGFEEIIRDWNVWINEVCDTMVLVSDEESAKVQLAGQLKLLDKKFERLRETTEKAVEAAANVKDKEEILKQHNAALDYYDESKASLKRWDFTLARLGTIMSQTSNNENMKRVHDFQWGNVPLSFNFKGSPFTGYQEGSPLLGGVFMPVPREAGKK
jgi:hypothetical protein